MYLEKLFGLSNKVAVVTGGSRGIGQTIACGLARAGAEIAILCRSNADETIKMIEERGGKAYWISTDIRKKEAVDSALTEILRRSGTIDILFNNAGICIHHTASEVSVQQFKEVMNVNVIGQFIVARAVGEIMKKQNTEGSIINMASMSGSIVNVPQMQSSYNASKAAVIHLTKSLSVEWAQSKIRVNSLSPGYVNTKMSSETPQDLKEDWLSLIPIHRFAQPEELITAILYLASDNSSYTTGSDIIIDGAYTCQ